MKVVNLYSEKHTVYIGRAGHGEDGTFGNPVKIGESCILCHEIHSDGGSTLSCYEILLRKKLKDSSAFRRRFMMLATDDVLGCFCKPDACHGDVIVKIWSELHEEA
ncbi:MAG: DUF4326 domain-containing protein [Nitrososphaerales archaeon]